VVADGRGGVLPAAMMLAFGAGCGADAWRWS